MHLLGPYAIVKQSLLNDPCVIMNRSSMLCEMCGKESDKLRTVSIEGTVLRVCGQCSRFGDELAPGGKTAKKKTPIEQRLERRERRMRSRDVYQEDSYDLAPDFPERIRQARVARDWKQETLAAKINEKRSVIHNLEAGEMRPDDALVRKLEKALNIKLMEKVPAVKPQPRSTSSGGLTLGDLIRMREE